MTIRKRSVWWLLAPLGGGMLLIAMVTLRYSQQKFAMKDIERFGGRVLTTHAEPAWLRRLAGDRLLKLFERGTVVNLSETEIADADLALLKNLQGLERLNLHHTPITDNGLIHLKPLTNLKALDLSRTRISGRGLKHLRGLSRLEYLYLNHTRLEDRDLLHLQGLKNLRHLDLTGTGITPEAIESLQRHLPNVNVEH